MSQAVTALLRLRELILSGELAPGERLSELSMVPAAVTDSHHLDPRLAAIIGSRIIAKGSNQ